MALCILTQDNQLLKNKGILTPVECSGDLLINRLENAGISIDTKNFLRVFGRFKNHSLLRI